MSKTFTVPITNDTVDEANETVYLALSNAVGASLGARVTAVLTITDNDTAGAIAFGAPVFTVGEAGPTATVMVTRTGGLASGASVAYAGADGTAVAGSDYTAASGTLVFGPGETSRTIPIAITNDALAEAMRRPADAVESGRRATARRRRRRS
jgi:hypothetical protein